MKDFLQQLAVDGDTAQAILQEHEKTVAALRGAVTDMAVESAVRAAGGRNLTAIRALLDVGAIGQAEDVSAAAGEAVERLRREAGYLFARERVSAPGTGTVSSPRPGMADLAGMSMGEYKRFRRGM